MGEVLTKLFKWTDVYCFVKIHLTSLPTVPLAQRQTLLGSPSKMLATLILAAMSLTAEQKETIVTVTALLCIKFGLTPSIDSITYHHWWDLRAKARVLDNGPDYNVKTCPCTGFFGGNSTTSAINNFYPLVSRKIQELINSNQ
ncbi:hypothetical protein [Neobacillus niacini]|uniref:hypothetical protein n=1 Tax=Neobacillus niacini TaxID=86668 RepID=UPI00351C8B2D